MKTAAHYIKPAPLYSRPSHRGATLRTLVFFAAILLASACGQLRPLPATVEPPEYEAITYQELLTATPATFPQGRKIKITAYFWQFLTYEPDMVRNYLTLAKYPIQWWKLNWFAVYGAPEMKGYFDRLAMTPEQRRGYRLKRLERLVIYGEMASLGASLPFLQVHRIERVEGD